REGVPKDRGESFGNAIEAVDEAAEPKQLPAPDRRPEKGDVGDDNQDEHGSRVHRRSSTYRGQAHGVNKADRYVLRLSPQPSRATQGAGLKRHTRCSELSAYVE